MRPELSVQLYTVRDRLEDFPPPDPRVGTNWLHLRRTAPLARKRRSSGCRFAGGRVTRPVRARPNFGRRILR